MMESTPKTEYSTTYTTSSGGTVTKSYFPTHSGYKTVTYEQETTPSGGTYTVTSTTSSETVAPPTTK